MPLWIVHLSAIALSADVETDIVDGARKTTARFVYSEWLER